MSKSAAIVTEASQGIGRATAIRLARDFAALVLVARNRANLEQTAEAVKASASEALITNVDVAQPSAAGTVVDQNMQVFGRRCR
jgi:3-oxoacyl-[acyl-carrier protein] reductase